LELVSCGDEAQYSTGSQILNMMRIKSTKEKKNKNDFIHAVVVY
jgi:hypothetical protein